MYSKDRATELLWDYFRSVESDSPPPFFLKENVEHFLRKSGKSLSILQAFPKTEAEATSDKRFNIKRTLRWGLGQSPEVDFFDTERAGTLLLAGAKLEREERGGASVLYRAVDRKNLAATKWALESGADIGWRTKNGGTALHRAAHRGPTELVELLILFYAKDKSLLNAKNSDGDTAFDKAARAGNSEILNVLVKAGAEWRESVFEKNVFGTASPKLFRWVKKQMDETAATDPKIEEGLKNMARSMKEEFETRWSRFFVEETKKTHTNLLRIAMSAGIACSKEILRTLGEDFPSDAECLSIVAKEMELASGYNKGENGNLWPLMRALAKGVMASTEPESADWNLVSTTVQNSGDPVLASWGRKLEASLLRKSATKPKKSNILRRRL